MIINIPKITTTRDEVIISSKIEWETNNLNLPRELWFKFPRKFKKDISKNSNAFVVSLILPSMILGEDIQINGEISSVLSHNLKEYMRFFHFWFPDKFKMIKITYKKLVKFKQLKKKGVLATFSGGVDSFYTLWKHLPRNESNKDFQMTHSLFIHGFDIPLEDEKTFQIVADSYGKLMDNLGIEMIRGSTNAKEFNVRLGVDWEKTHSSILAGFAMIFEKVFSYYIYSENDSYDYLPPFGTHLNTVHLLSTENLRSISYGGGIPKFEKIKILSKWIETYDNLRVCFEKPNGLMNCCKCKKCMGIMNMLRVVKSLNKYSTFPLPINRRYLRSTRTLRRHLQIPRYIIKYAKKYRRNDIAFDYTYILILSRIRLFFQDIKRKLFKRRNKI